MSTTTRRQLATQDFTEQVNATADLFTQRSAAIAKVHSDWQKCLHWAEWLDVMETITLDIAQGGAIKTGTFNAIEQCHLVLSDLMKQVTDQARQLELA